MDKIDVLLKAHKLHDEPIVIRMTGCPNGCGRPFNAEIGFVGKSMGRYNMYLGAAFEGHRLNKQYKENLTEEEILAELDPMLAAWAKKRKKGEHFGDFLIRTKVIMATTEGKDFWATDNRNAAAGI
jgi:sulfite reductase (NADPH) hemoprotein beta-component